VLANEMKSRARQGIAAKKSYAHSLPFNIPHLPLLLLFFFLNFFFLPIFLLIISLGLVPIFCKKERKQTHQIPLRLTLS